MEFAKEVPNRFNVFVVVSDIRIVKIEPVSHLHGQLIPEVLVFHHLTSAFFIIIFYGNLFTDIFLGNTKLFLHADLYREAMGVPSCLTAHIEPLHCLVTAKDILDGPGHHMMDARFAVC